jgi:hypothetical protein
MPYLPLVCFFLGSLYYRECGNGIFLRNIGGVPDYMALFLRRQYS